MTIIERVKTLCSERGIAISKLEKDLGFANGYISQLRRGTMPYERLSAVADYFDVSLDYLTTGKEKENPLFSAENVILSSKILTDQKLLDALKKYFTLSAERQEDIRDIVEMFYLKEEKTK